MTTKIISNHQVSIEWIKNEDMSNMFCLQWTETGEHTLGAGRAYVYNERRGKGWSKV